MADDERSRVWLIPNRQFLFFFLITLAFHETPATTIIPNALKTKSS